MQTVSCGLVDQRPLADNTSMGRRVRPHDWSALSLFVATLIASAPATATATDCADVARLRGPVTSVVEWRLQEMPESVRDATRPPVEGIAAHIELSPDRRSARIESSTGPSNVTTCAFDATGRVVRQVTRTQDERSRWQVEQDIRWTYSSRAITIRDKKSRYRLRISLDPEGHPLRAEGQWGYGVVPVSLSMRFARWAQEQESWELEVDGDVNMSTRRVRDLAGNLLVEDSGYYPDYPNVAISTYEFDQAGNWTRQDTTRTFSQPPYGWRTITRRAITYSAR